MADQSLNYDDPMTGSNPAPNPDPATSGGSTAPRPPSPEGSVWSVNTDLSIRTRGTMPPITNRNNLPGGGRSKYLDGNAEHDLDPSQFGSTGARADKKRKFDDGFELRAATLETRLKLAKRYDQLETRSNPATETRHIPLKEIKPDELEYRLHPNFRNDPSFIHTINDPQTDINFYSVLSHRPGRIIGKVDLYDRKAMEAMVDTLMAYAKRNGTQVGNFFFDSRSIHVDKSTSAYKKIQARNNRKSGGQHPAPGPSGHQRQQHAEQHVKQEELCGHCGVKGHTLDICCTPMQPPGKHRKGGSIGGCPFCNTMTHSIDDCSALTKHLIDLSELGQSKLLAKLLCFNRNNRPAIRSEKWFFLDVLLGMRSTWEGEEDCREHHLLAAMEMVPWTDPFSLQVLTAHVYGPLTPKTTYLPKSILTYDTNVSARLPQDPYWATTKVYQMIEYHKAGWYDDLRYFSATTLALAVPNDQYPDVEDLVFMWAKQAGLIVERTFGGKVEDHIALPDELPVPAERVITLGDKSITVPKEVLLNPGTWVKDDLSGFITYEESEPLGMVGSLVYKTIPAFDALVKKFGAVVWRAKRAVNDYRLGNFKPGAATDPVREWMHGIIQLLLDDSMKQREEERAEIEEAEVLTAAVEAGNDMVG